jgi:peptide/nickel transport system substrate-binding protein
MAPDGTAKGSITDRSADMKLRNHRAFLIAVSLVIVAIFLLTVPVGETRTPSSGNPGGQSRSSAASALIIAIPGTPAGIDLDRFTGNPQTWTIATQMVAPGAEFARIRYPYKPVAGINDNKISGFTYPNLSHPARAVPGLVTRCVLSSGGRVVTWHLRKHVLSAYGHELTSADVIWEVHRGLNNKAVAAFALDLIGAKSAAQWHARGKYAIRITSKQPMPLVCPTLTNLYYNIFFVDSKEAKKHASSGDPFANDWMATHLAAYGPYYVTSFEPGKQVVLRANPRYWQGKPHITRVIYKVVPNSSDRVALLRSGAVQLAEGLSPDEAVALKKTDRVRVAAVRSNLGLYGILSNKKPPFNDVHVRRAVNLAIPRSQLVKTIYRGLGTPWQGVYPSIFPGYIKFTKYAYNLSAARRELAKSAYKSGFNTTISYSSGDPAQESVAVALRTSLGSIGIRATLQKLPPAALSQLASSKGCAICLWLDFPIQPDINYSLRLYFQSTSVINYESYSNSQVDRIFLRGAPIVNAKKRLAFHKRVEPILYRDAPLAWILEPMYLIGMSAKLRGYGWYTTQNYKIQTMSLR